MTDIGDVKTDQVKPGQTRINGYHVAAMFIAFFAVVITANFTMAWFASGSWTGLVVKNSYVASQNYNKKIEAAKKQKAMGWHLRFNYSDKLLAFSFLDTNNQPIIFDNVSVIIGRPVSQEGDVKLNLAHESQGHYQARIELSEGVWGFQLTAEGNNPYRSEGRFLVRENGVGKLQ